MIKFGTGGWRAIIGEEFVLSNIRLLAQAIAEDLNSKPELEKKIVVGFDRRFLSDRAAKWTSEVFAANGITVYFIEKIAPTPLIMYTVKTMNTPYGIAITASHNPAEYNGIKVFTGGGRDAEVDVTGNLEKICEKLQVEDVKFVSFEKAVLNGEIKIIDPFNKYIDTILSMIQKQ
jgi:phosphomannomutase